MEYKTFYLNADKEKESGSVVGSLQTEVPAEVVSTACQSDMWEDDGAYFTFEFTQPRQLSGK